METKEEEKKKPRLNHKSHSLYEQIRNKLFVFANKFSTNDTLKSLVSDGELNRSDFWEDIV